MEGRSNDIHLTTRERSLEQIRDILSPLMLSCPKLLPETLYHGTGAKFIASIEQQGLLPMSRLYVHLSADEKTAVEVGRRHGKPIVFEVLSGQMAKDGFTFYRSVNGVWLTKVMPVKYLVKIKSSCKN